MQVGGSTGHVSIAIANAAPDLRFIVQDQPSVARQGEQSLPNHLRGRISFQAYDFFEKNPIQDASIYIFRWILHDWPDEDAVRILRETASSLKADAKILLCEAVVAPPGEMTAFRERYVRTMDMMMMTMYGGMERTLNDWQRLVERASSSLQIQRVVTPEESALSIIEIGWRADSWDVRCKWTN